MWCIILGTWDIAGNENFYGEISWLLHFEMGKADINKWTMFKCWWWRILFYISILKEDGLDQEEQSRSAEVERVELWARSPGSKSCKGEGRLRGGARSKEVVRLAWHSGRQEICITVVGSFFLVSSAVGQGLLFIMETASLQACFSALIPSQVFTLCWLCTAQNCPKSECFRTLRSWGSTPEGLGL